MFRCPIPDHRTLTWVIAGDRDPDFKDNLDHIIALDGKVEVGVVKLVPAPAGAEWMWSMLLTHPGQAFKQPTNGRTQTRGEAARELVACWRAFREWFGIED